MGLAVTEDELQDAIVDLAQTLGWLVYHTRDSRRSQRGFPDLVLERAGRLIFAELKTSSGTVKVEQAMWLAELGDVSRPVSAHIETWGGWSRGEPVVVRIWRTEDWRAGDVERELRIR